MDGLFLAFLVAGLTLSPPTEDAPSENTAADKKISIETPAEQEISINLLWTDKINTDEDIDWLGLPGDNLRLTLDLSSRVLNNTDTNNFFYAHFRTCPQDSVTT